MKATLLLTILLFGWVLKAQTYNHPSVGLLNTFSGACPEATCSGTYYDNGGVSGNYSNGINEIYQTFCPDSPGTCLRVNFSSWDMERYWFWGWNYPDFLRVLNGPAQNSPQIGLLEYQGANATFTANNSSGCLTFRFRSDGTGTRPGWTGSFSCVPCAARQPDGIADCSGAQQVCNNNPLTNTSPGSGSVAEGCAGCAGAEGEIYSAWYYFQVGTGGQLGFDLVPDVPGDDIDFALYGPNVDCGTLGSPIRCSYAISTGTGGMRPGEGTTSEGVFGAGTAAGWVDDLAVNAGDVYVLLINNWTAGASGYTINWTGSAVLDCTPIGLPVELSSFTGEDLPGKNVLNWTTSSEKDNDYFRIERSIDGQFWVPVGDVKGVGNSASENQYRLVDENIEKNIVYYYRLKQFDFDGEMTTHDEIVAILNNHEKPHLVKVVNLLGQEVNQEYQGVRIEIYSDGSRVKKLGGG